jgi:hypothetical protein
MFLSVTFQRLGNPLLMSAVGTKILGKIGNLTDWLLPSADQRLSGGDDLVIAHRSQSGLIELTISAGYIGSLGHCYPNVILHTGFVVEH